MKNEPEMYVRNANACTGRNGGETKVDHELVSQGRIQRGERIRMGVQILSWEVVKTCNESILIQQ